LVTVSTFPPKPQFAGEPERHAGFGSNGAASPVSEVDSLTARIVVQYVAGGESVHFGTSQPTVATRASTLMVCFNVLKPGIETVTT
jgi:hypothetical protein